MPQARARSATWASGVEKVSEMMPATGVMSGSDSGSTTISSAAKVSSS
jgi:hypothetical protein